MSWFDAILRPELAQLRAYQPAPAPAGAIRLDANESPHSLSDAARRHLADALARLDANRYPDVRATALRDAIAAHSGAHPDEIVLGCGSDELIALVLAALAHPRVGRARASAVFPEPSFVMYRVSALLAGLEPIGVPLDAAWDLDLAAMEQAIATHAPNVIFLPSPNNPTGNLFEAARIEGVLAAAHEQSLVLLDEAYGAFAGTSYGALRARGPHVGQLQTLSKIGLAAARVGWAILPRALAAAVDKVRQPYNLNAYSQRIAELALGELRGEFDAAVAHIVAERQRLAAALAALPGVGVTPSAANFLWLDVGRDAGEVYRALLAQGVVVRSFHSAGGRLARQLRVTVGTAEENDRFLAALAAVL